MAFRLVLDDEIFSLLARELRTARLLGIEMVKARLAGKYFPFFRDFQSFAV